MKRTIGGDRIGSGKKMTVDLKTYERSTHDLGYVWRSTMAAGTLVPFLVELGLPGDTFDIDLNVSMNTHPTIGPLFGGFKIQVDLYKCDVRLYQAQLHNNKLGIGMDMAKIKLPQIKMEAKSLDRTRDPDNQQINPSSIFSYLNIRGLGKASTHPGNVNVVRNFNAIPYLAYWDIYKNYYANKQEEIGAVIHNDLEPLNENVGSVRVILGGSTTVVLPEGNSGLYVCMISNRPNGNGEFTKMEIESTNGMRINEMELTFYDTGRDKKIGAYELFSSWVWEEDGMRLVGTNAVLEQRYMGGWDYIDGNDMIEGEPKIKTFPLKNLDDMRENILTAVKQTGAFMIDETSLEPYSLALKKGTDLRYSKMNSQEGLALKTYQSDMFNNWLNTEQIDGENGVNAITAIDTSDGNFTIDTLNLSKKVYDMLNRIAISGGTYDDWLDTVYTHERYQRAESPIYMGGLVKELEFQEVVSNAAALESGEAQPLGTLAGKGVMGKKHKGGKVTIKVDEPCYIIGLISATPRLDYSQGNKWDTNLKTMDDFHKPGLDEIGFQDLITDQMAWFDTTINGTTGAVDFRSAGKQPAWLNYMTNVNQVRGNFAIDGNQMFMTMNRKYEINEETGNIKDLTTYIDPVKFNHIFAEKARDAQNFWTQVGVGMQVRRKMSAKIMPNL